MRLRFGPFLAMAGIVLVGGAPPVASADRALQREQAAPLEAGVTDRAVEVLLNGSARDRQQQIDAVRAAPARYAPPVFYLMANVLFAEGEKDEAAFWFYAGQLRAQFDANRSGNPAASQAVFIMTQQHGSAINRHAFQDPAALEALIARVVAWDRKTPHAYDHRWIERRTPAVPEHAPGSVEPPREQWQELAERTRTEYLAGFREVMTEMQKRRSGRR